MDEFHRPGSPVAEFKALVDLARGLAEYDEMYDEIEAAAERAMDHYAELEALDEPARKDLARRLFAEARFRPLRFRPAQIRHAFDTVGYPHIFGEPKPDSAQILRDAILYLAAPTLREHLARQLFMCLPEYVSAGRYLDASMVLYCAAQTIHAPDRIDPFLGVMFELGYAEWLEEVQARQESFWDDLRLDHRGIIALSAGEGKDLQLLLSPEEVEPWVAIYYESLKPAEDRLAASAEKGEWDVTSFRDAVDAAMADVTREMAPVLLTADRTSRMAAALNTYCRAQQQGGHNAPVMYANLLAAALERPGSPEYEIVTAAICAASMRQALLKRWEEARKTKESGEADH